MKNLNNKKHSLKIELEKKLNDSVADKKLILLKDDFKIKTLDSNAICIVFSTKYFPKPVKISFIQKRIKDILEVMTFDDSLMNDILIAVEEVISNIIEHSYNKKIDILILFKFIFYSNKLVIEIEDFGKEGKNFSLYNSGNYSSIKSLHENVKKTGGGMGVYLVKKIMDDIKYESKENEYNKIILTKKTSSIKLLSEIFNKTKKYNESFIEDIFIKLLEKNNKYALINIEGYINTDNSYIVDEQILKIKESLDIKNFIFKMDKVEYVSSSGIEIFMKLLEINKKKNICLVGINDKIKRVFLLTGFLKYFNIFSSVDDAKKYYNSL